MRPQLEKSCFPPIITGDNNDDNDDDYAEMRGRLPGNGNHGVLIPNNATRVTLLCAPSALKIATAYF